MRYAYDPHPITAAGVTRSIAEWARVSGISADTIHSRLRYGWEPHEAVTEPVNPKKRNGRAR